MFCWHVEDLNMASMNYNHYGSPKFWYGIGKADYKKFENFVKTRFPELFVECNEFMRHKTLMINPYLLKKMMPELKIIKQVQRQGEFIITTQGGYHTGFNLGFNMAEAVNFCTPDWLSIFPKMRNCRCQKGNVHINQDLVYENLSKCGLISKEVQEEQVLQGIREAHPESA